MRTVTAPPRPSLRGYLGPGGGAGCYIDAPIEYRGTTSQLCGMWPLALGSTTPLTGVPFGHHLVTGASVAFDPISWYQRTSLISTPSMFVLGGPGLGKSAALRRMVLGLVAQGVVPLILGDTKGEYVDLVRALGGQVISVATGRDHINPLDVGPWRTVIDRVDDLQARSVRASVVDRRLQMVAALASLVRGEQISADETTVLAAAVGVLTDRETTAPPILSDVYRLIADPPEEVQRVTVYATPEEEARFRARLQRTLIAILNGRLGDTFDGQSTVPIDPDAPAVCIDLKDVDENDVLRTAASLLTSWAAGFGAISTQHFLADAGAAQPRTYFCVVDEMWRVLRAAKGLVDRMDALTRLGRSVFGAGTAFITHTMADLRALPTEEDRMKAAGFADRSSVLLIAASTPSELEEINAVRPLAAAERREVLSWHSPDGAWEGRESIRAGRGKFLIKVSERPGIPVQLVLTPQEIRLGNTDHRWGS
jgi:hypothetical protein